MAFGEKNIPILYAREQCIYHYWQCIFNFTTDEMALAYVMYIKCHDMCLRDTQSGRVVMMPHLPMSPHSSATTLEHLNIL